MPPSIAAQASFAFKRTNSSADAPNAGIDCFADYGATGERVPGTTDGDDVGQIKRRDESGSGKKK